MGRYNRIFIIVLDSLGIGAMPDAEKFGDAGTDTLLGHISDAVEHLNIPDLQRLGLANLHPLRQARPVQRPMAYYSHLFEVRAAARDTMTGHWEMMGIQTTKPFITFPNGFPPELIHELEQRTGHKVIGDEAASGT